jgi:protein-tyrosine-phosphatase
MVCEDDMAWADTVYGLTAGHNKILRAIFPAFADKIKGLPGGDVPDPIGGTPESYRACAARLEREIMQL